MVVYVPDDAPRRRQSPSPMAGECLRPLNRRQLEDRWGELGDLYIRTTGHEPAAWDQDRSEFLRRLAGDMRRPGFALLAAEAVVPPGTTVLSGCAYGFPVRGEGPWWHGLDDCLPSSLLRAAAAGELFAISEIVVERRVRTHDQDRDWNLARRLQRRLLADHAATLGVMLVERHDVETLDALWSWGWRYAPVDARGALLAAPCRVLILR
ncbi:hypothetical protein [Streptomyces fulvoviolaceus]|uniref:hypothetical protein n=1 Tax=Streptomyces fulvoviolaceus TaxID=285535 RepID=UPI000A62EBD4|nr:hypothetical protein [Streptomyces fulvoviolaceus]MCT9075128.1 hypothetical protein [Streptomyces fulvoviolaceus]